MLVITSPWPYFMIMAWFLCVAHVLPQPPAFNTSKLNVPMESLRGLLATGVFFCHAVVTYFFFKTGVWKGPPSPFYEFFGSGTVDMFFFVSGFLFWSKCISQDGIHGLKRFWTARVRRLVPAYYVSVLLIVLIVFARTGFSLREKPFKLSLEFLNWLVFCIPNLLQPINGVQETPLINAAVIWTLDLEIIFYILLPVLYWAFKGYRVFGYLTILALIFWGVAHTESFNSTSWAQDPLPRLLARFFGFGFGFGMLAALLLSKFPATWLERLRQRRWSAIPVLFLAGPILLRLPAHSFAQFAVLLVPFLFIAAGNDLFGLLSMRSTLLLGKSSYSFYVVHGIILYALSHLLDRWVPIASLSPIRYWLVIAVCGTTTVCCSYLLYRNVELRFMQKRSVLRQVNTPAILPLKQLAASN